jgi:hypothetical protein
VLEEYNIYICSILKYLDENNKKNNNRYSGISIIVLNGIQYTNPFLGTFV